MYRKVRDQENKCHKLSGQFIWYTQSNKAVFGYNICHYEAQNVRFSVTLQKIVAVMRRDIRNTSQYTLKSQVIYWLT